jgi:hypothetical protein
VGVRPRRSGKKRGLAFISACSRRASSCARTHTHGRTDRRALGLG